jgi:DNA-binding IclR family transcriptional regulator
MLPERTTSYPVPALEKGLDLLEFISAQGVPQSLADLARGLGRSPSELFRMVACLLQRGYLAREDDTGRYRLTLKLHQLAHTHSPVEQILRAADRPMRDLVRELRESVHLSVLADDRLVVLAQVESPEPRRLSVEVGHRFPPLQTCSGRLLLAYDETFTTSDRALARRLAGIRRLGVSTVDSETIAGIRDTAVLVGSPRTQTAAALCVPALGLLARRRSGNVLAALKRCARRINKSLGLA